MSLEFIYGERGNTLLKHGNYKYTFGNNLKNGNTRWRCTTKTCRAMLLTDLNRHKLLETRGEHNHQTDVTKFKRQILINAAKKKALDNDFHYDEKKVNVSKKDLRRIKKRVSKAKRIVTEAAPPFATSGLLQLVIEIRDDICDIKDSEVKIENICVNKMSECDLTDMDVIGDCTVESNDRQTEVTEPQQRRYNESEVMEVGIEEIEEFQKKYMKNIVCID
ncbi:hypothetical protein CBL_06525 [Carabus blaptoides fortunei]